MDYQGIAILIGAVAAAISVIGGLGIQIATFVRAGQMTKAIEANTEKVEVVHKATNSLVEIAGKAEFAKGVLQGRAAQKSEDGANKGE